MNSHSKPVLRQQMHLMLGTLPDQRFKSAGDSVARLITRTSVWEESSFILAFLSMRHEIDSEPLITRAFEQNKAVYVPRISGNMLAFYKITGVHGPWNYGSFSIREPFPDPQKLWNPRSAASSDLIAIIPGLAFDGSGGRLGRGKGYYDRFILNAGIQQRCVGICLHEQMLPSLPMHSHDIKVPFVVNDKGFIDCTSVSY